MPKGIRKQAGSSLDLVVAPGATPLPTTDGSPGESLPAGIAVRSGRGVQLEFMYEGVRCTETVPGTPTVRNVLDAKRLRESVLTAIEQRAFDYAAFFPSSRRVKRKRKADAEAKAAALVVSNVSMGELFDVFLERFRINNPGGQNTYETHLGVLRSHLRKEFGHLRPAEVSVDAILKFRERLRTAGMSVSRLSNVLTPLRGALSLAVERDLIARTPFDRISPTKPKKQRVVVLDEQGMPRFDEPLPLHSDRDYAAAAQAADPFDAAERESILRAMSGQVRNLFSFAFWTGLRTGELIALRWCDVAKDYSEICVRVSWSKKVFTPTKGRRHRWVPLLPPAAEALRLQAEHTREADRWVFNNPLTHDRWTSSERLRRRWKRALRDAKVRYRYQYQCRHTYASVRMSAGESAAEVASAMGHQDVRLVSIVYARFMPVTDQQPGARTIAAYSAEWARLSTLLADNRDEVTAEDVADEAAPDNAVEERDLLDEVDRP